MAIDVYRSEIQALDKLVDDFACKMKKKLHEKLKQGYIGWDELRHEANMDNALFLLTRNTKGQEVDIANYAMFLWNLRKKSGRKFVVVTGAEKKDGDEQ